MNSTIEKIKDKIIKDLPANIGVYVQPIIISFDTLHDTAPVGRDNLLAISFPFDCPKKTNIFPTINNVVIVINEFFSFFLIQITPFVI